MSKSASESSTASAVDLLKADHRRVEQLFNDYEAARDGSKKTALIHQICSELIIHTLIEEELFYPACRKAASDEEPLDEAQVEHDSAKLLIADLLGAKADDQYRDAKVKVLSEQIKHHVAEEEHPDTGIFAKAQAEGIDTPELAQQLKQRKTALQSDESTLRPSRPVSLQRISHSFDDGSDGQEDHDSRQRDDRRGRGHGGWYGDSQGHAEAARHH